MTPKKIIVIGSGFSGLSAASLLAQKGYDVTILEKNETPGGRARQYIRDGFVFDMGPSWYWMPDIFERYFSLFGKKPQDYFELKRLDPSYRIYWDDGTSTPIPANLDEFYKLFESLEPGSSDNLKKFLKEAAYKYDVGIKDLVFKPGNSIMEFADMRVIKGLFQLHLLKNFAKYIRKYFKNPKILQILEFPVLFLGAMPSETPALYSLMNYADIQLGTWYPMGGMYEVVKAMVKVAEEQGVKIQTNSEVVGVDIVNNGINKVKLKDGSSLDADVVVGSADYHHIEQHLLPKSHRKYSAAYWEKRTMAPSSLLFYVGVNKKIKGLDHHDLFFDEDFTRHAEEIYKTPKWPEKPLFYVSCASKTDPSVAPEGKENLVILIPTAPGLENDTEEIRQYYFDVVMERMEKLLGEKIKDDVLFVESYAHSEFIKDYHSFKGNAYGLANTLRQTAILKPSLRNKKVKNLYYAGQLTVPGPGVPPSLISGEVVAKEIFKDHELKRI